MWRGVEAGAAQLRVDSVYGLRLHLHLLGPSGDRLVTRGALGHSRELVARTPLERVKLLVLWGNAECLVHSRTQVVLSWHMVCRKTSDDCWMYESDNSFRSIESSLWRVMWGVRGIANTRLARKHETSLNRDLMRETIISFSWVSYLTKSLEE